MLLVLVLLMSTAAEAAGPAVGVRPPVHDTSGPQVGQPRAAAALMIGRWQLLGPATQAEFIDNGPKAPRPPPYLFMLNR